MSEVDDGEIWDFEDEVDVERVSQPPETEDPLPVTEKVGILGRILTIITMAIPIYLSFIGYSYYASMINVIIFGIGIVVLNIPFRAFNVKSKVTRILDFFWFTSIYGIMTFFNLVFTDPEGFGIFYGSIITLIEEYAIGAASFTEYLVAVVILYGVIGIFFIGFLSFFLLFFWQYNRALRDSEQSAGSAIMVYFALTSFAIFLGFGGATLVNYVVIILLVRGLLMHRREIRKVASTASGAKKSMLVHLLKTVDSPKLASYTVHLFVWGFVAALFLAIVDFTPITLGLFGLSILFIIDETPLRISVIIYTIFVFLFLGVAALSSAADLVLGILQAISDALYTFTEVWGGIGVRADWYATNIELANLVGITLDQLIFGAFAHGVLATFLGSYIFYGTSHAVEAVEGETYSRKKAFLGWMCVIAAIILEPILWLGSMFLSGNMYPNLFEFGIGPILFHLSLAIGIIPMLIIPFFIEVRLLTRKERHTSHIGANRYSLLVILLIILLVLFDASFVNISGIYTLLFGAAFLSFIFVWLPLFCKIRN